MSYKKPTTYYSSRLIIPLESSESEQEELSTNHLEGGADSDSNQSFVIPAARVDVADGE